MPNSPRKSYIFQSVVPDLPPPHSYLPLLEGMHEAGLYSNFGPLCHRFGARVLEEFGGAGETCVPCSSATSGLTAALLVWAGQRREPGPVLVPGFTFPATSGAVKAAGLEPVVMDVRAETWAIDPDQLAKALRATGAHAVVLVAPFGMRTDFARHIEVCREHGAGVVIDCASGMGVSRANVCTAPDVFEVFSLHATKPFGVGEGGLIFANASREGQLRSALNFALATQGDAQGPHWGFNGKISEMHAAVGLAQLERYRPMIEERQAFVAQYMDALAGMAGVKAPADPSLAPWQMFPVLMPSQAAAEEFVAVAGASGVEIRRYYRPSLSQWPGLRKLDSCPVSEDLASRMVALPVRRLAGQGDAALLVERVLTALRGTLARGAAHVR